MATINVLVVADGNYFSASPPPERSHGFNFAASDPTDDTFTLSTFIAALRNSTAVPISVDTAHRRNDPSAKFSNFTFSQVSLAGYDVLWLFGYEGNNDGLIVGSPIAEAEVLAISNFMNGGGGVFAAGDHSGLGSYMCGLIPRVRSMRKWFGAESLPAGYPVSATNWQGGGSDRADTLVNNEDGQWQFDNQSDDQPQHLTLLPLGSVHPILSGANGAVALFPDHMHEGEVILPWSLTDELTVDGQKVVEYPPIGAPKERPQIIATGTVTGGHPALVTQPPGSCENMNFVDDTNKTVAKTINVLCVYDGHNAGVGRIVTDSSFHHYIDLNLTGDPCGNPGRTDGFRTQAGQPILTDLMSFFVNTAVWLARPGAPVAATLQISPSTVALGGTCTGTITLDQIAVGGPVTVDMAWQPPGFATSANQISVKQGAVSASFPIIAPASLEPFGGTQGILYASAGGTTVSAELTLVAGAETGVLQSIVLRSPVVGGANTTGFVRIARAVTGPTMVTLRTAPTVRVRPGSTVILPVATVPSSVTIPAGETGASFTIATEPLAASVADRTMAIDANAFVTKVAILRFE